MSGHDPNQPGHPPGPQPPAGAPSPYAPPGPAVQPPAPGQMPPTQHPAPQVGPPGPVPNPPPNQAPHAAGYSHPHMQQTAFHQQGLPQQYAQQPVPGRLEVKTGFFVLAWMLHFVKPNVEVNGQRHKPSWGQFVLDLHPGQYHVHISFPWVFGDKTCPAQTQVNIYPGHVTYVSYEAPLFLLNPGQIKTGPPRPIPGLPPAPPPAY